MAKSNKRAYLIPHIDVEVDLVPLIDCIFLLLLFFILCGRISADQRNVEQLTVPPAKTATKLVNEEGWERVIISVRGGSQSGQPSEHSIQVGNGLAFTAHGADDFSAYRRLRTVMDSVYDRAAHYPDPKPTGLKLPQVVAEIRADADTEYRVLQEIQQVLSDSVDPATMASARGAKPFVNLEFTAWKLGDR